MDASHGHSSTCTDNAVPRMRPSANDSPPFDSLRADPVLLTPQERLTAFGKLLLRAVERRKRHRSTNPTGSIHPSKPQPGVA